MCQLNNAMTQVTDDMILQLAQNCGLAETQYEFSALLGRSHGYFSCVMAKHRTLSVAALGILASNLKRMIGACEAGEQRQQLRALRSIVLEEIERRCDLRTG